MAAWTTPDSTPTGQFTAARWDTYIRDNLIYLHDLAVLQITNMSGVAVANGSVVALSLTADGQFVVTTTPGDARMIGVAQANIADTALGYVAVVGRVNALNVTGAVTRQQPLQTSATAQYAQQGAGNSFARSLTAAAGPGLGSVGAFIHNRGSIAAHVIKDLATTYAQRTNLVFGDGLIVEDNAGGDATKITAGFPVGPVSATHGPVASNPTTTAAYTAIAAPGGGLAVYVTSIAAFNQSTTATRLDAKEGTAGTVRFHAMIGGALGAGFVHPFDPPWELPAATLMELKLSVAADVLIDVNFYVKAVSP